MLSEFNKVKEGGSALMWLVPTYIITTVYLQLGWTADMMPVGESTVWIRDIEPWGQLKTMCINDRETCGVGVCHALEVASHPSTNLSSILQVHATISAEGHR